MSGERQTLTVGFVGNPNCGKTTLFNIFTGAKLKVANWPGVTVEKVEGEIRHEGRSIRMIDLPGIYSLNSYSLEERLTRKCIESDEVDVIINVVDASSLERNLYLTLQLLELKRPVILALNMMDIVEAQGARINLRRLSEMLGQIPAVPVSARKRTGLDALMHTVVDYNEIKLQGAAVRGYQKGIVKETYGYIERIVGECLINEKEKSAFTDRADRILTHPFWGIPVFFGIMALVFFFTFTVGDFLKEYFQEGLNWFSQFTLIFLQDLRVSNGVVSLVVDGIVAGVGGILTFLPNIIILFLVLAVLEDSGYMSRVAYVMNETMGMVGLSGKAFLPMLLGFGCTVPAVMATRALESQKDRRRTILITPFMSCSARLPVYVLFSEMFFPERALFVAYSLYIVGLLAAILVAYVLYKTSVQRYEDILLIELPEYRMPNARTVWIYVWDKVKDYLTKAGTTIFTASVVLWVILNIGPSGFVNQASESFAAMFGHMAAPILKPAGLGSWQIVVALVSGISAKEVVVSSFSVLYGISNINSAAGMSQLSAILGSANFGSVNAYALMIFCLLYTPCLASIATIKRETRSWSFTGTVVLFQLGLAWLSAVLVFQFGSRIFS